MDARIPLGYTDDGHPVWGRTYGGKYIVGHCQYADGEIVYTVSVQEHCLVQQAHIEYA
jgi:hypothetical protein